MHTNIGHKQHKCLKLISYYIVLERYSKKYYVDLMEMKNSFDSFRIFHSEYSSAFGYYRDINHRVERIGGTVITRDGRHTLAVP